MKIKYKGKEIEINNFQVIKFDKTSCGKKSSILEYQYQESIDLVCTHWNKSIYDGNETIYYWLQSFGLTSWCIIKQDVRV